MFFHLTVPNFAYSVYRVRQCSAGTESGGGLGGIAFLCSRKAAAYALFTNQSVYF